MITASHGRLSVTAVCRAELPLDRIAQHVKRYLSEEKWPMHYKIVREFPMTGSGKIQKFKLAEMGQDEYL